MICFRIRLFMRRHVPLTLCTMAVLTWLVLHVLGFTDRVFEKDFDVDFTYPLEVDIVEQVKRLKSGESPSIAPIETYDYELVLGDLTRCVVVKPFLVVLIKSSVDNRAYRDLIRRTLAKFPSVLQDGRRFVVVHYFVLGLPRDGEMQPNVNAEQRSNGDILQFGFTDSYFNNTLKTVCEFWYLFTHCRKVPYALLMDDDYFVNLPNAIRYLRTVRPETRLYAGHRLFPRPVRDRTSAAWRISLEEYRFNRYPPYINAGAYVMTNTTVVDIHLAFPFVKFLRFDDVYVGITAWKLGIPAVQVDGFRYPGAGESDSAFVKQVIANHGYRGRLDLLERAYANAV